MDFIMVPLIMGIITVGIYKMFELFACRRERMAIIEKLGDKISATDLNGKFTLPVYNRSSFSALKGGCLMLGIGLGLLIGFFISASAVPNYLTQDDLGWNIRQTIGIIYGACVLLFGGTGLLIAFLVENNINNKKKEN
ncbi:DUF6249 domain-containing protein [Bacteroides sp.]